jgi:hypothetical protein
VPTGALRPNDDRGPRRLTALTDVRDSGQHAPFAWQDGRRLWLLDGTPSDWVLAELLFEPETCRYIEVRRSRYRWPREAAGVLLGRTLACGQSQAEEAARGLLEWALRFERAR